MSTRCMINFCEPDGEVMAKIYRHCDGYPEGVLPDLKQFFKDVEEQCDGDNRFNDPEYLAAKFVVWQANQNIRPFDPGELPVKMLNFLSLGIAKNDHDDAEYIYDVICLNDRGVKRPKVKHRKN